VGCTAPGLAAAGSWSEAPFSVTLSPRSLETGSGRELGIPAVPTAGAQGTHLCSALMHPPSQGRFCRVYWQMSLCMRPSAELLRHVLT